MYLPKRGGIFFMGESSLLRNDEKGHPHLASPLKGEGREKSRNDEIEAVVK